jgi:hypothetical protein
MLCGVLGLMSLLRALAQMGVELCTILDADVREHFFHELR